MQGLSRSGEDETDNTINDRSTVDRGSFASGAESAFRCGGGEDGDSRWKRLSAATDELEVPVRLTSRLLAALVPCTPATRTERTAFIDVIVTAIVSDKVLDKGSRRERRGGEEASAVPQT